MSCVWHMSVAKMPWGTIHPTTISAPIVGMAYGAYRAHVEHQGKRVRAAYAGEKAKEDPFAKVRIAEAASDIDARLAPVPSGASSCGGLDSSLIHDEPTAMTRPSAMPDSTRPRNSTVTLA